VTHINFYRISGDFNAALKLACQLTEKAFQQGLTVLLQTPDASVSEQLDQQLWTFKASSFLPHAVEALPKTNIVVSHHNEPGEHHGLLINLGSHTPEWFSRFEKAIEIVYDDEAVIEQKRAQFSFYKDRGYPMKYHDLTHLS
jgi:DNA polymerase-3 subunit chi